MTPVSYTHLDVYKRQLLARTAGTDSGHSFFGKSDVSSGAGLVRHQCGPVSYTHLDVYKRQSLSARTKVKGGAGIPIRGGQSRRNQQKI